MRLALLLGLIVVFLAGCTDQSASSDTDHNDTDIKIVDSDSKHENKDVQKVGDDAISGESKDSDSSDANEVANTERKPEYIDESMYKGDTAVLVQLINDSVRAINSGDEELYWSLFAQDSHMLQGAKMPEKLFVKVSISNIGEVQDESLVVGVILTEEREWLDDLKIHSMYVFKKQEGEWRIFDID